MAIILTATTLEQCSCCKKGGITLSCRTRGGVATLVGFSELTTPSTPPKKYLQYNFSGTADIQTWNNPDCTNQQCGTHGILTGGRSYNPSTGTIADTGFHDSFVTFDTGGCVGDHTAITDITPNAAAGDSVVVARDNKTVSCDLACHSISFPAAKRPSLPTYRAQLDDEYTETIAKNALISETTWSPWDSTGTKSCSAEYQLRTTSFAFIYQEAQWKVDGSGMPAGRTFTIRVHMVRAPFGSPSFTPYSTIETTATADSEGNFSVQGDIPNDQGFTTAAINSEAIA